MVMEACGSAHHWARTMIAGGIAVRLLPPAYVRAYVWRNETDAADAAALPEAARCSDICYATLGDSEARRDWSGSGTRLRSEKKLDHQSFTMAH